MPASDALALGRAAFTRRAWADACRLLLDADRLRPLEANDLEHAALAAYLSGDDAASDAAWTRAHQQHLDRGDRERSAWCAFWMAFALFHRGAAAPAAGWVARCARLLEEGHTDSVLTGYLLMPHGIRQVGQGDPVAGFATFEAASQIATRFGDPDLAALACHGRGRALLRQGRVQDGVALLDEAMAAVVADAVSPIFAGDIYCSVLEACAEILDLRRAREWTWSLSRWCGSQPDLVRYRGECLIYRAEAQQVDGAWTEALTDAIAACDRLQAPAQPAIGAACHRLGDLYRLRGEFQKAAQAYRQASQAGRRPQPGLSLMRLAQGEAETALTSLRTVLEEVTEPRQRARLLPALVDVALATHDLETARTSAAELSELAGRLEARVLWAAAVQARGAVSVADGDASGALPLLRDAYAAWRELAMPFEEAETHVQIGLASAQLGDTETRDLEFDAAREIFKRLGAQPALARLASLARPRSSKPRGGLSEREVQVLQLLAEGKTNRAIADSLFISEKTVARHVSNIFNKLGVSTRAAATATAYQRHLV
jgi:DNA-binding CsgD family transcriptional regulator